MNKKLLEMIDCTKQSLKIQESLLHSHLLTDEELIELEHQLNKLQLRIMDLNRAGIIEKLKKRRKK